MTREKWKYIQRQLRWLGHYTGLIDGIPGAKTNKAVRAFQKTADLSVDGDAGPRTCGALDKTCPSFDASVQTAARLIQKAYKVKKKGISTVNTTFENEFNLRIVDSCPEPGVEAYLLNNGYLLVPGSNSIWDYLKFNLRILNIGMPRLRLSGSKSEKTVTAASGITWHQGFFSHANHVQKWIGPDQSKWPIRVIGHSLGAASAQILSTIWSVPSVGFAAPRLRKADVPPRFRNLSLSICRQDDLVCRYPRAFERLGDSVNLAHRKPRLGMNHNMKAYLDAMENPAEGIVLPQSWDP